MNEIMELMMDVRKETRCADKYAKEANKHRTEFPELAQVYHRIAAEKLEHAEALSEQAEMMAEKHGMKALWDIEKKMFELDKEEVVRCLNHRR